MEAKIRLTWYGVTPRTMQNKRRRRGKVIKKKNKTRVYFNLCKNCLEPHHITQAACAIYIYVTEIPNITHKIW